MSKTASRIDLGKRLQKARVAAQFDSAVHAAEATGIHVQSVRDHEAGRRGVSLEDLETYSRKYGVKFEWLATGRGVMNEGAERLDFYAAQLNEDEYQEVVDFAKFKADQAKRQAKSES